MANPSDNAQQQPVASADPSTVPALLRILDAYTAPVEKQKVAVRAWLRENNPNKSLRFSLRRNGYGLLLDEADEEKGIPRLKRR